MSVETSILSALELDEAASLLIRLRSDSPAPTFNTAALGHVRKGNAIVIDDTAGDVNTVEDDADVRSAAKTFSVEDYFGVQYDEFERLHIVYACPYKCYVCGQAFASGARLRRHDHYKDSKLREEEIEATETRKSGCRVYHGNDPARRRARTLAKLLKKEEAECKTKHGKEIKKRDREMVASVKKELARKRRKDGPLVVIGAGDGVAVTDEDGRDGVKGWPPSCRTDERSLASAVDHHGHGKGIHARRFSPARRGNFQLQQQKPPERGYTAADSSDRDQTQLLSPPPTPHGTQQDAEGGDDDNDRDWDDAERTPMALELRLAKTQRTLRELRCNAPGCPMYDRRMASSQGYWGHLASEAHAAALKAWSDRGGDAVYVDV
ncbi:Zinc finger, C2H2 [Akanthomyces lecanii RCEF 1005]|uniref:Zinc finger, C2H2 n=1 Tax=Akanthomyces lecanii RCEF 1005 TaxID=1081108 RepID=A0A162KVQ1_CORDF|nr:Zinc finger, C2H2 [Akanthomyces lecanii RCEF 1005]